MSRAKKIQSDKIKVSSKDQRRRRKITWFNPPYSKNVATNKGKKFFSLLSMCFPPENQLYKTINKNTIKLSYTCMNDTHQIIASHNKTVLSNKKKVKQSKQDRAIVEINTMPTSRQMPSKRCYISSNYHAEVHRETRYIILESQRTSSKPYIINIYPASSLNIDHQLQPSVNTSGT